MSTIAPFPTALDRGNGEEPAGPSAPTRRRSGVVHERTPDLVHRRVELQADLRPDAVAVRFRDATLTYRELNRRANRLARELIAAGVGPEGRVVACLEPSVDVPVALLAALKAGAVYVPVDPTYPAARLRTLLEETRPALVLVQGRRATEVASDFPAPTRIVDSGGHGGHDDRSSSETNLDLSVSPEQTASIFYTSGTTGVPKGVMASYSNLAHYVDVAQRRYRFADSDVMPAIARFSFSISMFELLLPLVAGGTLLLLEREHVLDLGRMSRTLRDVTFFHAGPALLKNLLPYIQRHHPDRSVFSGVRHASSGGDMVPVTVLDALKDTFENAEVFVIYGCTEISCMGCTYPVARDRPPLRGCVGWPFDGTTVRVIDDASNEVPPGVAGEVVFSGRGITKGYLDQPGKTAERFVDLGGRRFYRTGDVGRIHEDGSLQLLGRSDFQVKIRGMRVELGEVEHHLRSAPGVRDAAATAREAAGGEKVLVAYVVMADVAERPGEDAEARLSSIRRHMAENLPDYMVPARYVELAALPLNPNMKLDRRALPEPPPVAAASARSIGPDGEDPGAARPADGVIAREPETPTERRLASLWKKLLQVDRVGVDDRFFELGGDSMLALMMIVEVDRELGVELNGLEVLHEPLDVLAAICDRRLGRLRAPAGAQASPSGDTAGASGRAAEPASERIEPFHFGPGQTLYGVLHGPRDASSERAALLCPPVGAEGSRTHFVLQQLARHLAAAGIAAMRFDYFACGDSWGENAEASCDRWQADIRDAFAELRRRTKATRIVAVGARFGATLLWNTARDLDPLAGLVLWDPVERGSEYHAELAAGHRRYVDSVQYLRPRPRPNRGRDGAADREELLGFTYSAEALRQMDALAVTASGRAVPSHWMATWRHPQQEALFRAVAEARTSRFEAMQLDCAWDDVAHVDRVLPDGGVARRLAAMVKELT